MQWVPHGYGWKAMNLPLCWWLYRRMRSGDEIDLMVHEPFVMFAGNPKRWAMAAVHRLMISILLRASKRVWCAIPMWETLLRPYAPSNTDFRRMPVFSCVPSIGVDNASKIPPFALGHFSSFGTSTARPLRAVLPGLLNRIPNGTVLLIGQNSEGFREEYLRKYPFAEDSLVATGPLPLAEISDRLRQCRVMLQAVDGGVSGRNTSVLAALSNGRPTVTTSGWLTEPFWAESGAVAMAADGDTAAFVDHAIRLTDRPEERTHLGRSARTLYEQIFDSHHLIEALIRA